MASFDERLRRLEERMARLEVPSLDEVGAAFGRGSAAKACPTRIDASKTTTSSRPQHHKSAG